MTGWAKAMRKYRYMMIYLSTVGAKLDNRKERIMIHGWLGTIGYPMMDDQWVPQHADT
jgi:hypothetical protein